MTPHTTVIVADDHRIVRQGIRAMLRNDGRYDVIAEADDGTTAVRMALEQTPNVVVMDVRMPGITGVEATRQITAAQPATKVIGLSGHLDSVLVDDLLRAGASGCVLKDAAVDELFTAILTALQNKIYISPMLKKLGAGDLAGSDAENNASPGGVGPRPRASLSPREQEVLQLVANGRSTKQAARDLSVSVKTIETHRRNLMEKLDIDNVAGLTKYAIRTGLSAL